MLHYLWRIGIAAFCFVAFFYIVPLFLNVLDITADADLWTLFRAIGAIGAIAYVIWGRQTWPWAAKP